MPILFRLATILLVLGGAALISASIIRSRKIETRIPPELHRRWCTLITMMIFFLAGCLYLVVILIKRLPVSGSPPDGSRSTS